MNYSFPRKKPSPVPKIIVTPEYLAKGSLKKSYINTIFQNSIWGNIMNPKNSRSEKTGAPKRP